MMKKINLFFVLVAAIFTANAQLTDNVTLNVKIKPLQSIVVNPSSKSVDLVYSTEDHFLKGVSVTQLKHLKVFSTGAFEVKVKPAAATLTSGANSIPVGDISILATQNATQSPTNGLTGFTGTEIFLVAGSDIKIGGSTSFGSGEIDVKYGAAKDNKYLNRVIGKTETTYTVSLVYTIIAL